MKVSVVGLGVEGKEAIKSLFSYGYEVYGTDLSQSVDMSDVKRYLKEKNKTDNKPKLTIELGTNNINKILSSDLILISPGLWKSKTANKLKKSNKLISDVLVKHKTIPTIAITGTNGKTTTTTMLKKILEKNGRKILVGGNAGGGFFGYTDLILKAEKNGYELMIVEVCDMTIEFSDYFFNFDMIGLTNIGDDHIDVHGSINQYKQSLLKLFKNKTVFLNSNEEFRDEVENVAKEVIYYDDIPDINLKTFGKFNQLNGGLASSISKYLNVDYNVIKESLQNFHEVEGRLKLINLNNSKVFIGKTDNVHATESILSEIKNVDIAFIGTSRTKETYRLDILDSIVKYNPKKIILFKGLSESFDLSLNRLKKLKYKGEIILSNSIKETLDLILKSDKDGSNDNIFIGGNGQEVITELQKLLKQKSSTNRAT
ncbi:MAG: UDP-N-acetylmuramoylalanine--D-glutamate ligase [Methanobrevibacter sp.]|jgi:UDP-N-acetylmuramoylalanine--D-glutamate ligase|nr:UDP-N-acetylmuramoylalanine--D-glutamate ligase [Candidatus Methanovirga aequatorialis]